MVVATLTDSHEDPEEFYPDGYAMYADPAYRGDFDGFDAWIDAGDVRWVRPHVERARFAAVELTNAAFRHVGSRGSP